MRKPIDQFVLLLLERDLPSGALCTWRALRCPGGELAVGKFLLLSYFPWYWEMAPEEGSRTLSCGLELPVSPGAPVQEVIYYHLQREEAAPRPAPGLPALAA